MLGIEVGGVGPGREGEENVLQFAIGEESEGGIVASRAKEGCCKMSQPQKKADNQKIKKTFPRCCQLWSVCTAPAKSRQPTLLKSFHKDAEK